MRLAKLLGYPIRILRVNVNSYSWARVLLLDSNVVSDKLYPTRGIAAGNFGATFEITVYVLPAVRKLSAVSGLGRVSVHIGDLSMAECGVAVTTLGDSSITRVVIQ